MMYNEFTDRLPEGTRKPTDSEYEKIELVYANHPSISQRGYEGKDQIARLYAEFGMRIICDMYPTAEENAKLGTELIAAKNAVERIKQEIKDLSMA